MSLRISDEPDVLYGATGTELRPEVLLTDDEGQVSDEDRPSEVFPRVHAGVATAARDLLVLTFLLVETLATCVHSQVSLLKQDLVELYFGHGGASCFPVQNVCVLVILELSELLLDNFGALWLL